MKIPTHNSRNTTPNPMNTEATNDTSSSLDRSRVNLLLVTSYLYCGQGNKSCMMSKKIFFQMLDNSLIIHFSA